MSHFGNAGSYLVDTIIGFYLFLVLARFWMQWTRSDFRNPIGQFIITLTNPFIIPLRKFIPSIGTADTASIILALLIASIKTWLLASLSNIQPALEQIAIYAVSEVIRYSIYLFIFVVFVRIISSWFNPYGYNPLMAPIISLSEPLMAPARRITPNLGGLDLSPMLVFIFLNLSLILIADPIQVASGLR